MKEKCIKIVILKEQCLNCNLKEQLQSYWNKLVVFERQQYLTLMSHHKGLSDIDWRPLSAGAGKNLYSRWNNFHFHIQLFFFSEMFEIHAFREGFWDLYMNILWRFTIEFCFASDTTDNEENFSSKVWNLIMIKW